MKAQLGFLCAALAAYAAYSIHEAWSAPSWLAWFGILTAIAGLLCIALRLRFTLIVVLLICLRLLAEWLLSIWLSVRIGYFAHTPPAKALATLLPGVLLITLAGYCCLITWRWADRLR